MPTSTPRTSVALTAILLLLAACAEGDPPNLTGTYALESVQSSDWTGGSRLTPPAVTGSLLVNQARYEEGLALGHARLELSHSSGANVRWSGSYTNGMGGVLTMRLNDVRFEGQYDYDDGTLTTELSGQTGDSGPSPVGTFVWKLEPSS